MKRHRESSGHSAKRKLVAGFLVEGFLHIKDIRDIVLEYSAEFEGRRTLKIKIPWEINALAELQDGRIALACDDSMVRIFDLVTGECVQTLAGHTKRVSVLAVLSGGKLASGSWDGMVRVWDKDAHSSALVGHTDWVYALAVLPDGKLASGSADSMVRVWDPATGECLITLAGHTEGVFALAVLPDGKLASGSLDKTVRVWDMNTLECMLTLPPRFRRTVPDGDERRSGCGAR
jgi:WD40 repeat protein